MKKLLVVGLVVLVAVVFVVWGRGDRDERLIRKAFSELAEAAEFEEREDMLKGGIRSRLVGGFFTPELSVDISGLPRGISSRAELITMVFHLRTQMDQLKLDLRSIEVEVHPDRRTARLAVSARAHVKGMGQEDAVWRDAELDWIKTEEDGWRISAMRTIQVIKRV